jgi:hypothetical protein
MKLILIILTLIPFSIYSQNINIKYESGIDSLIIKNNTIQQKKDGVLGWRIQLKFKSTKEEINKTRAEFMKLYPETPTYLTYESPYYRICVGNFRTKNEALKLNNFIRRNFVEAYPVKKIIKISELRN